MSQRPHRRADRPPTLAIEGLAIEIAGRRGAASVAADIDLEIWPGEIVGLIGESGSGKTMISLAVLGLLPHGVRVAAGEIRLSGERLSGLSQRELKAIRGKRIAMV